MLRDLQDFHRDVRELHTRLYNFISEFRERVLINEPLEELADTCYALREIATFLNDSRKECDALKEEIFKAGCQKWVRELVYEPIRTEYCRCTPKVKQMSSLPRRDSKPEEWRALMDYFGVPRDIQELPEDVLRPNFTGMVDYLTRLAEQGIPLPPGIDPKRTYPVYSFIITGKKGVEEPSEQE